MQQNLGAVDRLIRFVIGVVLAILVIARSVTGTAAIVIGIIAIGLVFTSVFGFCGVYSAMKFSTLKRKTEGQ